MLKSFVGPSVARQLLLGRQTQIRVFTSTFSKNQTSSSSPTPDNGSSEVILDWTQFFSLRKQQKIINTASSVTTAFITSSISWQYISNIEIDPTQMIFGFDPFMIYFAGFIGTGGLGYLLGPVLGNLLFRLKNSSQIRAFRVKDTEFRIKINRNRVDPSSQSFSNPVPDYYGEKIKSLKDYRNWLRDCYTYKRKAKEFL